MKMRAYDLRRFFGDIKNAAVIDLPEDLTTIRTYKFLSDNKTSLCYSASMSTWYVFTDVREPKDNVYFNMFACGTWVDVILSFDPYPNYIDAPFRWGEIIKSDIRSGFMYLPIWESVPTGEYNDDTGEIRREEYTLVKIRLSNCFDDPHFSNMESNLSTSFEIEKFDKLVDMVATLQARTGKKF